MSARASFSWVLGLVLLAALAGAAWFLFAKQRGSSPSDTRELAAGGEDRRTCVVVAIDGWRPDWLHVYGAPIVCMPRLDRFARTARVFSDCTTESTATNAAVASLLTGLAPDEHSVHGVRPIGLHRLPERCETLAERLRSEGFATLAAVSTRQLSAEASGFERGFDVYRDRSLPRDGSPRGADETWEVFDPELVRLLRGPTAVFALLHLGDPLHGRARSSELDPDVLVRYLRPFVNQTPGLAELLERVASDPQEGLLELERSLGRRRGEPAWRAWQRGLAAARLAAIDRVLGALFDRLAKEERLAGATVAVVGTRGRYLTEARLPGDLEGLAEAVLRVPCLVKLPEQYDSFHGSHADASRPPADGPLNLARLARLVEACASSSGSALDSLSLASVRRTESPGRRVHAVLGAACKVVAPNGMTSEGTAVLRAGDELVSEDVSPGPQTDELVELRGLLGTNYGLNFRVSVERPGAPALSISIRSPDGWLDAWDAGGALASVARGGRRASWEVGSEGQGDRVAAGASPPGAGAVQAGQPGTPGPLESSNEHWATLHTRAPGAGLVVELSEADGLVAADAVWIGGRPLGEIAVPRLPEPAAPFWDEDEPWLVDVVRDTEGSGRAVHLTVSEAAGEAPGSRARVYAVVYPPRRAVGPLVVRSSSGERLSPEGLPGAVFLAGRLPFEAVIDLPGETLLALAVEVDGRFLDVDDMRYLGRRFAESALKLYLPPWLPARADWFVRRPLGLGGLALEAPSGEGPSYRIELEREEREPDLGPAFLDDELVRFLQALGPEE